MKTLATLYPYLTKGELNDRFSEGVRILIKVKRFSNKITAGRFFIEGAQNGNPEVLNFFASYKREKAPTYKALKNAKGIFYSMPANSKVTINS